MFGFADDFTHLTGIALYCTIFALPFIQEDAAVIGAATASLAGLAPNLYIFGAILAGLTASDIWKYWIGHFARRHVWAHKFAEKPGVSVAGDLVRNELAKTLFMARYVPGTRIPTYVACGFFKVHYGKFVVLVILTAFTYVLVSFALFHTVGAVAGEQAKYWMPAIAVALIAAYAAYRWYTHRNHRDGPMTPMTHEFDHPLPGMPGFGGTPLEGHEMDGATKKEDA